MTKKLTLTIEEKTIELAKDYAQKQGVSLSGLIEEYLKLVTSQKSKPGKDHLTPNVKKLLGSVKLPAEFDYKKELQEALEKKHTR